MFLEKYFCLEEILEEVNIISRLFSWSFLCSIPKKQMFGKCFGSPYQCRIFFCTLSKCLSAVRVTVMYNILKLSKVIWAEEQKVSNISRNKCWVIQPSHVISGMSINYVERKTDFQKTSHFIYSKTLKNMLAFFWFYTKSKLLVWLSSKKTPPPSNSFESFQTGYTSGVRGGYGSTVWWGQDQGIRFVIFLGNFFFQTFFFIWVRGGLFTWQPR